ncbi:MAG: hypothetical protein JWP57_4577 [Spirosoma sp.]|nr:hypothetical protein [Spirosoma sp.]
MDLGPYRIAKRNEYWRRDAIFTEFDGIVYCLVLKGMDDVYAVLDE